MEIAAGIILLLAVAIGGIFWLESKGGLEEESFPGIDTDKITKDQLTLMINDSSYHENETFRKGDVISIDLRVIDADIKDDFKKKLFDENLIELRVEGSNKNDGLDIFDKDWKLSASYTAHNEGKDKIMLSIKGTDIRYEMDVSILDSSFFTIPMDMATEDVIFKTNDALSFDSIEIAREGKSKQSGEGWWDIDLPGHLAFIFNSDGKKFEKAYLEIYPIAEGVIEEYERNDQSGDFLFLENIKNLKKNIDGKPVIPEELDIRKFPPINASAGPSRDVDFIDFKNGTGIRYVIAGYYQAHDPSKFPIYRYQGITNDGKYYVLFTYSNLYSPDLESYLNKPMPQCCGEEQEVYDEYVKESFAVLKNEKKLSPSIKQLDQFIESIEVKH